MLEVRNTVVVGAGQAGLAIGHFLAREGRDFTILDAAAEPAAAWRARWDSLKLFTPVRFDSLPGFAFPGPLDAYPGRDDVVEYLAEYARRFALPVELGSRVTRVVPKDDGFSVELADRTLGARHVVIATGPFQTPRTPRALAAALDPAVAQLHSADYRRPDQIAPGPVLVVGGGNTGYQIAEELATTHEVHLAIGAAQIPLPQRIFGRDVFRVLDRLGAMDKTVDSKLGRRMRHHETLVGYRPAVARRQGIRLHGRALRAAGGTVAFADGTSVAPRTVIWATGFVPDHAFVDAPVFAPDGRVLQRRGETSHPGLYFLGLPWMHTRGSALLGWVEADARHISEQIAHA